MDIALNHKFTPMELRDINNCRMYLRVETLSDITTACGNFVQQTALGRTPPEGPPDTFFSSIPTKLFPRQSKPGLDAWKNWLKLIKISTGEYKGRLDNKLGNWHATGAHERMWKSYIRPDNNDNLITMIRKGTWEVCQIFDEKRTTRKYEGTTAEPWITDSESLTTGTWIPVDIKTYDEHWITTGQPQQQNEINDQTELENDEKQLLAHLEMDQYEKLKNILTTVDTIQISVATKQHQQQGWYTWTITSPTLAEVVQSGGRTHGYPTNNKRNELFGIAAAITIVDRVTTEIGIENSTVKSISIYVTNNKNYRMIREWSFHRTEYLLQNWDILEYTHQKILAWTRQLLVKRFPPEQHDESSIYNLTKSRDTAIQRLQTNPWWKQPTTNKSTPTNTKSLHTSPIVLRTNEDYICGDEGNELRRRLNEKDYMEYLVHNKNMSPTTIAQIAWSERRIVMESLNQSQCTFIGKMTHGWLPTEERLHRIGESTQATCPRCGKENETQKHVFLCEQAQQWKEEATKMITSLFMGNITNNESIIQARSALTQSFTEWIGSGDHKSKSSNQNTDWFIYLSGLIPAEWLLQRIFNRTEVIRIIRCLIQMAHRGWLLRCNQLHDNTEDKITNSESLLEQTIKERARKLHCKKTDLLAEDQKYFDFDIEDYLIGRSYQEIKAWCTHTKKFLSLAQNRAKRKHKSQTDLRNFLTRDTNDKYPP